MVGGERSREAQPSGVKGWRTRGEGEEAAFDQAVREVHWEEVTASRCRKKRERELDAVREGAARAQARRQACS